MWSIFEANLQDPWRPLFLQVWQIQNRQQPRRATRRRRKIVAKTAAVLLLLILLVGYALRKSFEATSRYPSVSLSRNASRTEFTLMQPRNDSRKDTPLKVGHSGFVQNPSTEGPLGRRNHRASDTISCCLIGGRGCLFWFFHQNSCGNFELVYFSAPPYHKGESK